MTKVFLKYMPLIQRMPGKVQQAPDALMGASKEPLIEPKLRER